MERKIVNCITINTDASFNHESKSGGYAFYIICDYFKIQKSGMFKSNPINPIDAEVRCIANAIQTLLNQPELPKAKNIVINSDCMSALHGIKKKSLNKINRFTANKISELGRRTKIGDGFPNIKRKHVKAHSDIIDSRTWVNDWCDREAKKWMRIAHKKNK